MRIFALLAVLALAGCGIVKTIQNPNWQQEADDKQCQSYGHVPGTPGYGDCRMQIDAIRAANAAASAARTNAAIQGGKLSSQGY